MRPVLEDTRMPPPSGRFQPLQTSGDPSIDELRKREALGMEYRTPAHVQRDDQHTRARYPVRDHPFTNIRHSPEVAVDAPRPSTFDDSVEDLLPDRREMLREVSVLHDVERMQYKREYKDMGARQQVEMAQALHQTSPLDIRRQAQETTDDLTQFEQEVEEEIMLLRADDNCQPDTFIQPHYDSAAGGWRYPSIPIISTQEQLERASPLDRMLHVNRLDAAQAFVAMEKKRVQLEAKQRYQSLWDENLPIPKAVVHLIEGVTKEEIEAKWEEDSLLVRRGRRQMPDPNKTEAENRLALNRVPYGLTAQQAELLHPRNLPDDTLWIQEVVHLVQAESCNNPSWPTFYKQKVVRMAYKVCCKMYRQMMEDKKNGYFRIQGGVYHESERLKANLADDIMGRYRFSKLLDEDYVQPCVYRYKMPKVNINRADKQLVTEKQQVEEEE